MRVRYEMYKNGQPAGVQCDCDLTDKQAEKKYNELESNLKCGWAELVGEDDDNYMDILKSFEHIRVAIFASEMLRG